LQQNDPWKPNDQSHLPVKNEEHKKKSKEKHLK
jgi:hypothetical protein